MNDTREVYRNIIRFAKSFADVYIGEPLVYVNSLDYIAVAINQGSFSRAYNVFGIKLEDPLRGDHTALGLRALWFSWRGIINMGRMKMENRSCFQTVYELCRKILRSSVS